MNRARGVAFLGASCGIPVQSFGLHIILIVAAILFPGGLYLYDEYVNCQVLQRGLRALYCGASIYVSYKFIWTPENSSDIHGRVARLIVETCKDNEGLFVKFGQLLGSMQVALPPEYLGPLEELHDKAKTFESEIVRDILKSELSAETVRQLIDLSIEPVASASVAQVHTAYFHGRKVAVKVQKPNIAVQTKWDLLIYKLVLTALEYSFDIPLVWSYDFVRRQLESELDFNVEAKNARQCREDINRHRDLSSVAYVPEAYESSRRVIITEWIDDAVKITDTEKIRDMGVDSRAVIKDATNLFAYQIFGSGNVHCDPHPGNLLVRVKPVERSTTSHSGSIAGALHYIWSSIGTTLWGGSVKVQHQVVLIDHGLYVHLDDELRTDYISFWMAVITDNDEVLVEKCKKWGVHDSELFSSMTLMRRRDKKPKKLSRNTAAIPVAVHYENEEMQDTARSTVTEREKELSKEKAERALKRSQEVKERVKNLLKDTSKFPDELGFVNRSVNYIRATNWAHGSPIDRVSIFANTAARASVGDRGCVGEWSIISPYAVWRMNTHVLSRLWAPNLYYGSLLSNMKLCQQPSSLWK